MGTESEADRNTIGAAISQLRPTCEKSLFVGVGGDSNLVLVDMKNQIRANLELIEALAALLSGGLRCSYAALVLARSSYEHSVTTAWVFSSLDPHQWTARFASLLADELKQQTRIGTIHIDENSGPAYSLLEFLKDVAGPDVLPIKPLPNMRERSKVIDADDPYLLYGLTSQVVHGSRAAYQARYGWDQDTVKVDRADEWRGALRIALRGLEQAVYQFAQCASLDSVVRQQLPDRDDACIKIFREAVERRSAPVLSLVDQAMSCV